MEVTGRKRRTRKADKKKNDIQLVYQKLTMMKNSIDILSMKTEKLKNYNLNLFHILDEFLWYREIYGLANDV